MIYRQIRFCCLGEKLIGAAAERKAILRKVREMIALRPHATDLEQFIIWLLARHRRYNKRAGGLGK